MKFEIPLKWIVILGMKVRYCLRALEITTVPFAARDFGGFQGTRDEHIL